MHATFNATKDAINCMSPLDFFSSRNLLSFICFFLWYFVDMLVAMLPLTVIDTNSFASATAESPPRVALETAIVAILTVAT
jgi:hypothetical protein